MTAAKKIKKFPKHHKKKKRVKRWYVAYFSPSYYKRLVSCFQKFKHVFKDVEMWYPCMTVYKVKKGKRVKVEEPLYPGYVFFRFYEDSYIWMKLIKLTPIFGFLKDASTNKPIPLTDEEVERVKKYASNVNKIDYSYLVGKKVIIIGGPFEDFIGICKSIIKGRNCARVELFMINSLIREVEISLDLISLYDEE